MNILPVLKFITNHPLNKKNKIRAVLRFLKWQLRLRLNSSPIVYSFTDKAKLLVRKGMTGATGNLYCGLHEFNDMAFLLHFLRESDTFADIGANVGSFTVLASAHVGAKSISFEPVKSTFTNLTNNIAINHIEGKVTAHNMAVGSENGFVNFTNSLDTMNHVANGEGLLTSKVPLVTLDTILQGMPIPILLKIDVEGFETNVVQGAENTLQKSDVKAIIIELPGAGERYGHDESKIHDKFIELKFKPYQYSPMERKLIPVDKFGTYNTLYIRDLDFVQNRLDAAPKVKILNYEF